MVYMEESSNGLQRRFRHSKQRNVVTTSSALIISKQFATTSSTPVPRVEDVGLLVNARPNQKLLYLCRHPNSRIGGLVVYDMGTSGKGERGNRRPGGRGRGTRPRNAGRWRPSTQRKEDEGSSSSPHVLPESTSESTHSTKGTFESKQILLALQAAARMNQENAPSTFELLKRREELPEDASQAINVECIVQLEDFVLECLIKATEFVCAVVSSGSCKDLGNDVSGKTYEYWYTAKCASCSSGMDAVGEDGVAAFDAIFLRALGRKEVVDEIETYMRSLEDMMAERST